jgi:hypothetical protein
VFGESRQGYSTATARQRPLIGEDPKEEVMVLLLNPTIKIWSAAIVTWLIAHGSAVACGGDLDLACNLGEVAKKGAEDVANTGKKAIEDAANTGKKAIDDSIKTGEKAVEDTVNTARWKMN